MFDSALMKKYDLVLLGDALELKGQKRIRMNSVCITSALLDDFIQYMNDNSKFMQRLDTLTHSMKNADKYNGNGECFLHVAFLGSYVGVGIRSDDAEFFDYHNLYYDESYYDFFKEIASIYKGKVNDKNLQLRVTASEKEKGKVTYIIGVTFDI